MVVVAGEESFGCVTVGILDAISFSFRQYTDLQYGAFSALENITGSCLRCRYVPIFVQLSFRIYFGQCVGISG